MTKFTIPLKAIVAALLACGLYAALAAALANRTFVSGKNCFACNKLTDMSWKIIFLGTREGAYRLPSARLGIWHHKAQFVARLTAFSN
jgi:hypothetical protein